MKTVFSVTLSVICFLACFPALAQMDAAAQSYVTGGSVNTSGDGGFDSSLYVKKPAKKKRYRKPASDDSTQGSTATGKETGPAPDADLQNSQVAPLPRLGGDNYQADAVPQPVAAPPSVDPSLGSKMRDMFWGGDPERIDQYRAFLDSEDIRKNLFEFSLATTYMYDTSMSPYFFRNYIDSSPGACVGLNLWLTPFLGISADYRATLLDSVQDSPTQSIYVNATQTWFDLGLNFRRFFGMAVNASSLTVGLKYADYVFSVPPSSQSRIGAHNDGPEVSIDVSLPAGRSFSWTAGLELQPFVTSSEIIGQNNIGSGASNQTVGYGASVGGEYRMSRQTRAFFKLSTEVYKSQFSGSASNVDPVTGQTPSGVPVTNVFYMFDLGIRLGR